jgi:hypothetical protein
MINELIVVCMVFVLVFVLQGIFHQIERRRIVAQNKELMDRLMSVDFQSYAAGKRIQGQGGDRQWKKKMTEDQDDSPEQDHIGLSVT